ncbi:MAG TPA: MFS transporter, partial [Dehalococcoidia bacterium]|nr:MFS transporter [Dehalococcoidia bacterium]
RWAFYVNIPVGAIAMLVTLSALKLPYRRLYHPIDYTGAALMVAGVSSLLLVTAWGGKEFAWTSPEIFGLVAAGIILLALFVWQETRAAEPLLPLRLFRMRVFSLCTSISFLTGWGMLGAIAFLPVYMQVVKGVSATESGLRLLPMMCGVVGMSVISGRLISRTGRYRVFPIAGCLFMAVGLYLLSNLDVNTGFWQAGLYMFVMGSGLGMVMQVTILAVQNDVEHRDLGTATAGVNFFRSMGGAFGVAILGSILNNRLDYYMPRLVPEGSTANINPSALRASPHVIHSLPPDVVAGVVQSFANSLQYVFLAAAPLALGAFALSLLLRETPLKEEAHVGARERQASDAEAAMPPVG